MIEVHQIGLGGVLEIVTPRFNDSRGFFSETYSEATFTRAGISTAFVQDNHSYSVKRGVLRGLHYQLPPKAQDKLVRVVRGAVFDVAVDIRRGSPSFGKWVGVELSAEKWNQLLVPRGFAHGFVTLQPDSEVVYKVSELYAPEYDRAIRFDDPKIAIDWPVETADIWVSEKDGAAPLLDAAEIFD